MAAMMSDRSQDRRQQVMLGELPRDFLRVNDDRNLQISADEQAAWALQQQATGQRAGLFTSSQAIGRLTLTVAEARLVKNYGMTRMDPYVRLRIGHNIYETHTHYNGAKNPHWDKTFHCFLSPGVNTFLVEIYDECAFSPSEKIAWAHVEIPQEVFASAQPHEMWVELSGRQGEGKEGAINLVMSYQPIPPGSVIAPQLMYVNTTVPPAIGIGGGAVQVPAVSATYTVPAGLAPGVPMPVGQVGGVPVVQQQAPPPQPPPVIREEDVRQLNEMFPSFDADVIKSLLESHRGDKDRTITDLLALNTT